MPITVPGQVANRQTKDMTQDMTLVPIVALSTTGVDRVHTRTNKQHDLQK